LVAAVPSHWLSPIIRSHSLPLELSSLRKRSAKLVQGTNSNFIWMPLSAVKSLDSSASAFAGSQAAQHSVSCWFCALAELTDSTRAETAAAASVALVRSMGCLPV
jgi:hypothetical protein